MGDTSATTGKYKERISTKYKKNKMNIWLGENIDLYI